MDKIGKYEIVRELGTGATSTVYLAIDPFNKQEVAIKLFDLSVLRDPKHAKVYRKLLMTEASLAGKLSHPHIAKILDAVMEGEANYVVMEYVEGSTLEQYAEVDKLLPVSTIAEIAYKCCKALEYAQHQGVIHRDIKPANILLQGETDIKISDFGSAALQSEQTTQVAEWGRRPICRRNRSRNMKLTHQTDIYSLGVVMYKLLTGKLPFDATNNHQHDLPYHQHRTPAAQCIPPRNRGRNWMRLCGERWKRTPKSAIRPGKSLRTIWSGSPVVSSLPRARYWIRRNSTLCAVWCSSRISAMSNFGRCCASANGARFRNPSTFSMTGESGRSFFILAQGTVRVTKQGRLLSLLHRGDCFGEMAHLLERDFKRSSDVIAKNDVVLIEINPDVLMHATIRMQAAVR